MSQYIDFLQCFIEMLTFSFLMSENGVRKKKKRIIKNYHQYFHISIEQNFLYLFFFPINIPSFPIR